MMTIRRLLAPAILLGAVLAQTAGAQTVLPLSFEVRAGAGIPMGDFNDGASTGWGVGGTLRYAVAPNVDVFAGFDHFSFAVDDGDEAGDLDLGIDDDGFRGGARLSLPLASMAMVRPWVEAGVLVNRTSLSVSDGSASIDVNSDWTVGFEAGAGFAFDVAPKISLTPGVRYRQHKAEFDTDEEDISSVDAKYIVVDIGVNFRL